ncbi:hypothetical protein [Halorubrum sp. Hd13]|uniref:hypothetical protein n=1 Tax=Halorubrum sp. Hd13 TaxID=1480728 RepID=UPI00113FFE7A|nr:hypothetical protein [Halorubrum sp. Hd13]
MTLSDQDRAKAEKTVSPFNAQSGLDEDMPNVLWNMLQEFADRPNVPSDINLGKQKIYDLCDQRSIGPVTLDIEHRLSAEMSDYSFEARYKEGLSIEELSKTVKKSGRSFPAVEVDLTMYDPTDYDVQPAGRGTARKLRLLVLEINHKSLLYYDPLRFGETNSDQIQGIESSEINKQEFVNAWRGRSETTTTLWIEETDQSRLQEFK